MNKYCTNCGSEIKEEDEYCLKCGYNTLQLEDKKSLNTKTNEKKFATWSIVFGLIGIYPLLGIGGIIGMRLAKKGMKISNGNYRKHLQIGYWISLSGLIFWSGALIISLFGAFLQIFRDIWEMIIDFMSLFI